MYAEGERSGKIRIPSWMEIKISNNGDGLLDLNVLDAAITDETYDSITGELSSVIGLIEDPAQISKTSMTVLSGNVLDEDDDNLWVFKHSELKNFYFGVQNNTVINRINKLYRSSSIGNVNNNILTMSDVSTPTIEGKKIILVLGTK